MLWNNACFYGCFAPGHGPWEDATSPRSWAHALQHPHTIPSTCQPFSPLSPHLPPSPFLFIFSRAAFSCWSHQKSPIHCSTPPWWGFRNCFLWGPLTVSHSLRGLYPLGYITAGWIVWIGEKQDGNREKQSCSSRTHADLEILTPAPSSLLSQSVSWWVNLSLHLYSGELQKL